MPIYVYAIVNAVLAAVVVGGIARLLCWAIVTQHRDPGCADVRLQRLRLRRVTPARAPRETVPPEIALT